MQFIRKSLGTSSLLLPSSQGSRIDTLRYIMKISGLVLIKLKVRIMDGRKEWVWCPLLMEKPFYQPHGV